MSGAEGADRDDVDPVGPDVAVAGTHDDGEDGGRAAGRTVDPPCERREMRGGFVDAVGAEFDLKRAPALARVDDRVDLEPGLVSVVIDGTVERLCVHTQIAHDSAGRCGREQGRAGRRLPC